VCVYENGNCDKMIDRWVYCDKIHATVLQPGLTKLQLSGIHHLCFWNLVMWLPLVVMSLIMC